MNPEMQNSTMQTSAMQNSTMQSSTMQSSCLSEFECFQNYTASEVFVHGLSGIVNQSDVETIIRSQKQMLQKFEKTNEMLKNCNALSQSRIKTAAEDYRKHCKLLIEMKKDLEYVFKKIRVIKGKLETKYPEAFEQANKQKLTSTEEDDELSDSDQKKEDLIPETTVDYVQLSARRERTKETSD